MTRFADVYEIVPVEMLFQKSERENPHCNETNQHALVQIPCIPVEVVYAMSANSTTTLIRRGPRHRSTPTDVKGGYPIFLVSYRACVPDHGVL